MLLGYVFRRRGGCCKTYLHTHWCAWKAGVIAAGLQASSESSNITPKLHLRKPEMDFPTTRHHSEMEADEMGQGWGAATNLLSSTSALKGAPGLQDKCADSKWTVTIAQTVRHVHSQICPCKCWRGLLL